MLINEIANLPDVSFIDNITLDDVQAGLVADYEKKYKEITGKDLQLHRADPEMLKLYACSIQLYQMFLLIDKGGKMGLLKYAYSDFLDYIGAFAGTSRLPAHAAKCTVKFTLSAKQASVITIPKGTRVCNGDALYFATDDIAEIEIGKTEIDIPCTCLVTGEIGNDIAIGSLNILVDRLPYVDSVSNIEITSGGSEVESDDDFANRIYLAPSQYSVAGPVDAYIYHTKSCNAAIGDVAVASPEPGCVDVLFLLQNGDMPTDSLINEVSAYLSDKTIRPLTDKVTVKKPQEQSFDINVKYFINQSNHDTATAIQDAVKAAVADYITWQTSTIGRDINPSVLIQRMMAAGAKRIEVTSPEYTVLASDYVARVKNQNIVYGGIEDD